MKSVFNVTSHMSQLLKLSQRQRSFLSFAQEASNDSRVAYKMNNEGKNE